jgi:hypothetical protein
VDIPATSSNIPGTIVLRDAGGAVATQTVTVESLTAVRNFGSNASSNLVAKATGTASGQRAGVSFYPTFGNFPTDTGPRRAADIWAGFTGTWGTQYLSIGVGSGQNDVQNETPERVRIKAAGQVRFVPRSGNPSGAEAGDVYYDSGDNKLKVYNGTSWENLH